VKTTNLIAGFSVSLLTVLSAQAQATFQNLDFESANLSNPSGPYNEVPISSALPGWSASIGGVPVTEVWANDYSLGAATIDVFGPGWNSVNPGIIDGNYTVYLQSGSSITGVGTFNTSISQDGTIPANAQSLEFKASTVGGNTPLSVFFAGNNLSVVDLSSGQDPSGQLYNVYGVNIASYEGQTGQLEFTAVFPNWTELDDIAFSTNAVTPEPGIIALTAMGGLLFGARKWFARR
jgi:hypothetical protein